MNRFTKTAMLAHNDIKEFRRMLKCTVSNRAYIRMFQRAGNKAERKAAKYYCNTYT